MASTFRTPARIEERIEVGGITVEIRNRDAVVARFEALGGKVLWVSDKGAGLEFPSPAARWEYMEFAQANGAIFQTLEA